MTDQDKDVTSAAPEGGIIAETRSSFVKELPAAAGKKAAGLLLAGIGFLAVWLWGWVVGGGLTRIVGGIPSGAVVAFSLDCPKNLGWSPFKDATGRFVIGAGKSDGYWNRINSQGKFDGEALRLSERSLLEKGGEEKHQLMTAELPQQKIQIFNIDGRSAVYINLNAVVPADSGTRNFGGVLTANAVPSPPPINLPPQLTFATGGQGVDHNTMPPFVSLHYCVKDGG